ncbi:DUF3043 domain-containing protein [Streptacidiphilus sp. P02-A3a]|uniref:DUF3043 domain-containing protein n=1 Tax=Streptacidiphilus sp. P02-A3a TaxID=2704468 RepID=UPI0015FE3C58|nr:DUF3043 domain-containing protein [Streptacidiphilus sp. P02-A3a]QMU68491.1 DUF3043 domain-containing protein [Streptacidiphilus sp. P02-A3a]
MFRRSSQDAPTDSNQLTELEDSVRPDAEAKKGRPTPKRSEAEANRRGRAYVPQDRKEAARAARDARRADQARTRSALINNDERAMPNRDRGPVRRFVRDYIDSRFTAAEWFLPLAVIVLVMNALPSASVKNIGLMVWVLMIVLIVLHSVWLAMSLRKQLAIRFAGQSTKGAVGYAMLRSLQMRRLRLPKPLVKRGQKP